MKVSSEKKKVKNIFPFVLILCFSMLGSGCEAFVKKFKRTPRKELSPETNLVLEPQVYEHPLVSREERAWQHYSFWSSWHDELIRSLQDGSNRKKQIESAKEAGTSLADLALLVRDEHKAALQGYSKELLDVRDEISADIHGMYAGRHLHAAQRLKREIKKKFPASRFTDMLL